MKHFGLLVLAHEGGCEAALAAALESTLDAGRLPNLDELRRRFAPSRADTPPVHVALPPPAVRLPGAATCVRLSGRAGGGVAVRAGAGSTVARPEAEGRFAIDARTDTDLGPVRTYVRVGTGRR